MRETSAGATNTDGYKKPFVAEIKTKCGLKRQTKYENEENEENAAEANNCQVEGNDFPRYDGVVQQIATRHILAEDMANTEVGKTVHIKWGGVTWTAVVIQLPDDTEEHPAKATTKHFADGTDKNPAAKRQKK